MSVVEDLIGDEARSSIGRQTHRATVVVYKREFQRWAAAVGETNPLYFDDEYAKQNGHRAAIAPPLFVQALVAPSHIPLGSLRPDGVPNGNGDWLVSLPKCSQLMAGGDRFFFSKPLHDGDSVTVVGTIRDIVQKSGRSGEFVVVINVTTLELSDGTEAARFESTMIARP